MRKSEVNHVSSDTVSEDNGVDMDMKNINVNDEQLLLSKTRSPGPGGILVQSTDIDAIAGQTKDKEEIVGYGSLLRSFRDAEGLTTWSGALALISTIIGGGIVGLPFAFYYLGIPLALAFNVLAVLMTRESGRLYLAMHALVPDRPDSLYEIGYMLSGRSTIFVNAIICVVNSIGLMMIYFIVFSETMGQLVGSFWDKNLGEAWYADKPTYVIGLGILLIPVVIKKELAELEWLATLLFCSIALFVLITGYMLCFDDRFLDPVLSEQDIWRPKMSWNTVSAICTTLVAYSYQQNVFPIYSSLKNKSKAGYMTASTLGLFVTTGIYMAVSFISIMLFGKSIQSSVLLNIGEARTPSGGTFWESYVVQVAFCVVLVCHVPFVFFAGKEGLCIIVDECMRKSISNALFHKLQATNAHFLRESLMVDPPNIDLPIPGDEKPFRESVLNVEQNQPADLKLSHRSQQIQKHAARMSMQSTAKTNRMAYKDMNYAIYLLTVLGLYFSIMILAILISDITTVFDFASAIAITALAFFFPALGFLKAQSKYAESKDGYMTSLAWFFIIFGIVNFIMGVLAAVLSILGVSGGE
jgi:amino acid permease